MRKPPKRITVPRLQRITAYYLERYTSSVGNLRRLLLQRVRRSAEHHQEDPEPWIELVEQELSRLQRIGMLNDAAYARDKARSLVRRGNGARQVRAKLQAKAVPAALIDSALAGIAAEMDVDPELAAAVKYARRRRLGPFGPEKDPEARQKDLQRFARAGFSFDLARQVLDAPDVESLSAAIDAGRRL